MSASKAAKKAERSSKIHDAIDSGVGEATQGGTPALAQDKLRRENVRLRALVLPYELSRTVIAQTDLKQLLDQIVNTAREETHADVVSLMLVQADGRELAIAAASGLDPGVVASHKTALGAGIAGWVAAHGVPLDEAVRQAMGKPEVLSALSLPLTVRREVIGVLNLARLRGAEPFTHSDLELAAVLAGQAANAIDTARLIEDLRMLNETSQRLASALDLDEAASIIVKATAQAAQAEGAALWLVDQVSHQLSLYKTYSLEANEFDHLGKPASDLLGSSEQFAEQDGKGVLWLPISRGDKKFGLIELHLPSPVPPRPDRVDILRALAHTAASVVEAHRLRAREAIAYRELESTLRSDLDLHQFQKESTEIRAALEDNRREVAEPVLSPPERAVQDTSVEIILPSGSSDKLSLRFDFQEDLKPEEFQATVLPIIQALSRINETVAAIVEREKRSLVSIERITYGDSEH